MKVYILFEEVLFKSIIGVFKNLEDAIESKESMGIDHQNDYFISEHDLIE